MPTFELTTNDGKTFQVDADNADMAQKALDHAFGGAPAQPEAPAGPSQWDLFKRGLSVIASDPSQAKNLGMMAPFTYADRVARGEATIPQSFGPETPAAQADPAIEFGASGAAFGPLRPGGLPSAPLRPRLEPALPPADITVRPTPRDLAIQQGDRMGIPVPTFVASDSPGIQALGQAARQLPFAGGMIEKSVNKFTDALGSKAGEIASEMTANSGLDKAGLGEHLRGVMEKAVDNLDEVDNSAYSDFRGLIEPTKPVKEAQVPLQEAFSRIMPKRMAAEETGLGYLAPVARLMQRPEGVTFDGLQRARSRISKAIRFDKRNEGFEQGDLKQMYGALTDAMGIAAEKAAKISENTVQPEQVAGQRAAAVSAWKMADQTFSENLQALSSLGRALKSPADEALLNQVLGMAAEKTGNAKRLVALQQHIGPENMRTLGAHVIEQAGKAGEDWSPAKFVTNMDKLSETAKQLFFGKTKPQVDDLLGLTRRWKGQEGAFKNTSNTGRAALTGSAIGAVISHPILLLKAAAGAVAGVTLGEVLTRPATAKAAVQLARASERLTAEQSQAALNAFHALQRRFERLVRIEFAQQADQSRRSKEAPRLPSRSQ